MSGLELIDWAVKQCEAEKIPPTDGAILQMIRTCKEINRAILALRARLDTFVAK